MFEAAEYTALYMSDFFVRARHTLNTLCLFYDRLFLHDYFGIFICLDNYSHLQGSSDAELDGVWAVAGGLDSETKAYLRRASKTKFDGIVLKGVAQGLGCSTGPFSPAFLISFAHDYAAFLRHAQPFFEEGVMAMCQSRNNPFHPTYRLEGGVKLSQDCTDEQNAESLRLSVQNNKRACLFEQKHHELPLISDSEEDQIRWDRTKDLLATALLLATVPVHVPTISEAPAERVLQAREQLRDLLPPFRSVILKATWEIGQACRESSMEEALSLARLYAETQIEPVAREIAKKLKAEDTKLRHKLLKAGIDKTILLAKAVDPTEPLSKWDLVGSGLKSLLDVDESRQIKHELNSPYEFLVRLPAALR